jgi:glutamate-1-semialdehyde aminotransferase
VSGSLRHTLFTWSAQAGLDPISIVAAEGAHFTDAAGRKILDLASLSFNAGAGIRHPRLAEAIAAQATSLPVAGQGMATEIRGRYGEALAGVTPNGLDKFLFTLGGADANEHAIKIARLVTGRPNIVTRHRSYHGATLGALAASGDPRRLPFRRVSRDRACSSRTAADARSVGPPMSAGAPASTTSRRRSSGGPRIDRGGVDRDRRRNQRRILGPAEYLPRLARSATGTASSSSSTRCSPVSDGRDAGSRSSTSASFPT